MKIFLLSAALLLGNLVAQSQDWMPFVKNQKSYYGIQTSDSTYKVDCFYWDSTVVRSDNELLVFDAEVKLSNCIDNLPYGDQQAYLVYKNEDVLDSLILTGDTVYCLFESDSVIFKPYVNVGDSWVSNGITIACSRKYDTIIFGVSDSVKVFNCTGHGFNGEEYLLSKK